MVSIAAIGANTLALLPIQILFLNLVTDVFPALALGMGKGDPHIMRQKSRELNTPIISRTDWISILIYSLILTTGILGIYFYALHYWEVEEIKATSIAFYTLALAQLFHPFNLIPRSEKFLKNSIVDNRYMWGAIVLCLIILVIITIVPVFADALSLYKLTVIQWTAIMVVSLMPVLLIRMFKLALIKPAYAD